MQLTLALACTYQNMLSADVQTETDNNTHLHAYACLHGAGQPTAHVAACDLAAHSTYFMRLFENSTTFPGDTMDLQRLAVGIAGKLVTYLHQSDQMSLS